MTELRMAFIMRRARVLNTLRGSFLCGLVLLSSCRSGPTPGSLDDLARKYVALAAELGDHDLDSLDFNISPKSDSKRAVEPYLKLHDKALALQAELTKLPDAPTAEAARKALLLGQVNAITARVEQLQGTTRAFDDESRMFFGVAAPADHDADARKNLRVEITKALGNPTDAAQAYSKFGAQFIVPAERVPAVMQAALAECRSLTLAHMQLPPGEHVDFQYVRLKPWSAYSTYLGGARSLIQVNMDSPLTVDRLLTLACHEGYPGHHVFNLMREQALVQKEHREEFMVQPTFSPQSYVSEAAASYAPFLVLSDSERLRIERDVLAPIAGLKDLDFEHYLALEKLFYGLHTAEPAIAREYLDEHLEFVRAADEFERETLMQHAETTLLYLNEFRSYMLAYTVGSDSVQALVENGHPLDAERWRRYVNLMTSPVVSPPLAPN